MLPPAGDLEVSYVSAFVAIGSSFYDTGTQAFAREHAFHNWCNAEPIFWVAWLLPELLKTMATELVKTAPDLGMSFSKRDKVFLDGERRKQQNRCQYPF